MNLHTITALSLLLVACPQEAPPGPEAPPEPAAHAEAPASEAPLRLA